MNSHYYLLTICLFSLTCIPSCKKENKIVSKKEDVKIMIELDNDVSEIENKKSIEKF